MRINKFLFCFLMVAALASSALSSAFAQDNTDNVQSAVDKSKYYVVQIPIEKIYPHGKGWVIEYNKNGQGRSRMFIPMSWFTLKPEMAPGDLDKSGKLKGQQVRIGSGRNWPHVSLYYIDGVVDHVKIYTREELAHPTWGAYITDNTPGVDENLENVENIKISR
ncbi:MAG: hypothetical protein Ta2G_00050 [Termitinemataceae bacterium]|nr:MAG: hypothetical protein Ta2G_00050 [Termitinemataceae bacterium]